MDKEQQTEFVKRGNVIEKEDYKHWIEEVKNCLCEGQIKAAVRVNGLLLDFYWKLGSDGFAYIGRQMELRMPGGKSYFPDMVFYHTKLKCYVVLGLKVVEFQPEFMGKLNFYVSAADHLLKDESDNPSTGLLICKSKDDTIVQWSFSGLSSPLGVATYEFEEEVLRNLQEKLPTIEDIENGI